MIFVWDVQYERNENRYRNRLEVLLIVVSDFDQNSFLAGINQSNYNTFNSSMKPHFLSPTLIEITMVVHSMTVERQDVYDLYRVLLIRLIYESFCRKIYVCNRCH